MATGIKDKAVILGMACAKFGERWDANAEDLMVEAFEEAIKDAGIELHQIEAAWFGTAIEDQHVGKSGVPLAMTLRLPYIPVTRVENYCATGTQAFRGARAKHGGDRTDLKRAMAHISVKSHENASKNPKAHLRNRITEDDVLNAPMVAEPLGLYDCFGGSARAGCAQR